MGFWADNFFPVSRDLVINASVGASIETAQTKVRTIRVRLSQRPAIGDGACALSIAQRMNIGTLASRLFPIDSRGSTSWLKIRIFVTLMGYRKGNEYSIVFKLKKTMCFRGCYSKSLYYILFTNDLKCYQQYTHPGNKDGEHLRH